PAPRVHDVGWRAAHVGDVELTGHVPSRLEPVAWWNFGAGSWVSQHDVANDEFRAVREDEHALRGAEAALEYPPLVRTRDDEGEGEEGQGEGEDCEPLGISDESFALRAAVAFLAVPLSFFLALGGWGYLLDDYGRLRKTNDAWRGAGLLGLALAV